MKKRAVISFCLIIVFTFGMTFRVLYLTEGEQLAQAAQRQSTYRLDVAETRGTIYDCNQLPLTNSKKVWKAVVFPTPMALSGLSDVLGRLEAKTIMERLQSGKPIIVDVPAEIRDCEGIYCFQVPQHYTEEQTAVHLIGYLDSEGVGVSGIEEAYNELLSGDYHVRVSYKVDAVGRVLTGGSVEISDTIAESQKGIALTIDRDIQKIAETAANELLETGSVVIMEVSTGKIKAMASTPGFSPDNVSESLENTHSPMLNRTLESYNVGSIFKLVAAQAALEKGVSLDYLCTGTTDYAEHTFQCINRTAHGQLDMQGAVANSCNCYFIHLSELIGADKLLSTAQKMGFGASIQLAPGIASLKGQLPTLKSLEAPAALANFSFGQGDLMATPLQIAAYINTIAANGIYRTPTLIEGTVDERGRLTKTGQATEPKQLMSMSTAIQLQQFMIAAVQDGGAYTGAPETGGAGAKTATAETGWVQDGHAVIQAWYAGYFPSDTPKYTIVVLAEDGTTGSGTCGPVFKKIADDIQSLESKQ